MAVVDPPKWLNSGLEGHGVPGHGAALRLLLLVILAVVRGILNINILYVTLQVMK